MARQTNIYRKLQNMRAALKQQHYSSFSELVDVIGKKAKDYKIIPLYSYLDNMATLTIVDMDDINSKVKFQVPADMVSLKNAKEHLYNMAFDIEYTDETITPRQYEELCSEMKEKGVTEQEIIKRYGIKSLPDMSIETYKRCMSALRRMSKVNN